MLPSRNFIIKQKTKYKKDQQGIMMIIIIIALTALCDKEPPKILLSSSCVGHLLLAMGPSLKNGLCTQRDAIGENYFFL